LDSKLSIKGLVILDNLLYCEDTYSNLHSARHMHYPIFQYFTRALSLVILATIVMTDMADAQVQPYTKSYQVAKKRSRIRYRPSKNRPPYQSSRGTTGTRGACVRDGCLTAIAPFSHTGQSQSSQPLITWHVPKSQADRSMILTMYRWKEGQRELLWRAQLNSQAGMNIFTVSAEQALKPGEYIWQVVVESNDYSPAQSLATEASIAIVQRNTLGETDDHWYDQWREAIDDRQQMQKLIQDLSGLEIANAQRDSEIQCDAADRDQKAKCLALAIDAGKAAGDRLLKLKFD
jgi:Ni/Co efflux regulator RcnB